MRSSSSAGACAATPNAVPLLASLEAADPGERVLVARFDTTMSAPGDAYVAAPRRPFARALARVAAAIAFVVAAVKNRC